MRKTEWNIFTGLIFLALLVLFFDPQPGQAQQWQPRDGGRNERRVQQTQQTQNRVQQRFQCQPPRQQSQTPRFQQRLRYDRAQVMREQLLRQQMQQRRLMQQRQTVQVFKPQCNQPQDQSRRRRSRGRTQFVERRHHFNHGDFGTMRLQRSTHQRNVTYNYVSVGSGEFSAFGNQLGMNGCYSGRPRAYNDGYGQQPVIVVYVVTDEFGRSAHYT